MQLWQLGIARNGSQSPCWTCHDGINGGRHLSDVKRFHLLFDSNKQGILPELQQPLDDFVSRTRFSSATKKYQSDTAEENMEIPEKACTVDRKYSGASESIVVKSPSQSQC